MQEILIYDQVWLMNHCLEGDDYCPAPHSQFFGVIPLTEVVPHYIERGWQVGNFQALQEWEAYCYDWEKNT